MATGNWSTAEKDFLQNVVNLATLNGWLSFHDYDSRFNKKGYPDLTLVRPPRVIFAELKSEKGRVSVYQQNWIDNLKECPGVEMYVWRHPGDWDSIISLLSR